MRNFAILLLIACGLALTVGSLMKFSAPVAQARVQVLQDVIAGRSIAYTPFPIGYTELVGQAMRWNSRFGLAIVQGFLYVLAVMLAWCILRDMGVGGQWLLAGALAVAVYPNLLLTITRFQDTCLSCFLMIAFVWLVLRLKRDGFTAPNAVVTGLFFGAMLLVRPNGLTIVPIAVWAAFRSRRITGKDIALVVASVAIAMSLVAAVNVPLKGGIALFDRYYAAYTFANGAHQHALEGTLRDYNGEMRMGQSFKELNLPMKGLETRDDALADEYMAAAWQFIRSHPFQYVLLDVVRVANLFRPDFRNSANSSAARLVSLLEQTAIAAIFFVWCFLRAKSGRWWTWNEGFFIVPLLILYVLPFVFTNSDPRYRFPFDALFILDSVVSLQILFRSKSVSA